MRRKNSSGNKGKGRELKRLAVNGKTWEEIHGIEQASRMRKKARERVTGSGNPMFGRVGDKHPNFGKTKETDEGIKRTSDKLSGRKQPWTTFRNKTDNPSKRLEVKEKQSRKAKERWSDPKERDRQSRILKQTAQDLGETHPSRQPEFREARRKFFTELNNEPKFREKKVQRMKSGGAAYMNSFVKNPSEPQVEIYNLAKSIYEDTKLNYPCLNYSIDVAVLPLKIAIEYDGSFWHKDKEKDEKRQRKIELEGWKFIRYIDYVPTENELLDKIKELRNLGGV